MLLHEVLAHASRRTPDATALVADGATRTFAELEERTARLAAVLQGLAAPGDRVAVVADNCTAWVDCYYGVPRAGMVLVPLNQRLSPAEQADLLRAAGASVLVGQRRYVDAIAPQAGTEVVAVEDDYEDRLAAACTAPADVAGQSAQDVAWLLFTSGTTGRPKGAMLTHASVLAAVLNTALARPVLADDVYLFPFPLCHVAGYNLPLFHLHGRPVVLVSRFDPAGVVEAVDRHRVTATSLAPTMLGALLDHVDGVEQPLPSLRSIGYGASGIAPELLRRAAARLGVGFSQGYGMTELSGNAVFLDADAHRRALAGDAHLLQSCGRPAPMVSVRLVDGEIAVRGDQVTAGYWDDPDTTAAAFLDGWFLTGDLGRFDDEGFLYVIDRKKDIVVTGGENVSSREVEDVLQEHPGVAAAAVVGVPDPYWGEAVCAVVVARDGVEPSPEELVAHARGRLASFKKPRHVLFVDALPTNAGGKVVKAELRRLATARLNGESA